MADNIIELSQETAAKVDRILWLLEGDQYRPGLLTHVQRNAEEIERLKLADSHSLVSTSTLLGVAWIGGLLVLVLTWLDRMVLISEVRAGLDLSGYRAVAVSVGLGLLGEVMLIFVVLVITLRWLGWGRAVARGRP